MLTKRRAAKAAVVSHLKAAGICPGCGGLGHRPSRATGGIIPVCGPCGGTGKVR